MNNKTIIFDMDGTLIDTEKYYRIFWPKALERCGFHMTDEQALSMRSLGRPFAPVHLKEMFGDEVDYIKAREIRKEMMEEFFQTHEMELKKGVVELLDYLKKKNIQTAVATASDYERTERYLKKLGIFEYFDQIICATMVEKGKPAPDVYLYACKMLNRKPEDCIAVEDSPNGIYSAFDAGLQVIMVPDQTAPDDSLKKKLYACVDSLLDIRELLEK